MNLLLLTLLLATAGVAAPIEVLDRQTVVPSKGRHYGFPRLIRTCLLNRDGSVLMAYYTDVDSEPLKPEIKTVRLRFP